MGKKEKVVEVKPPSDYFNGVQLDLKNVKTAVLNLESIEVSVLRKCALNFFNHSCNSEPCQDVASGRHKKCQFC